MPPVPDRDCTLCPRLAGWRQELRTAHPDWFNAPVPSFGALSARLLIVGLAPGLNGANRTGRPFTGDYAGDLLYATLAKFGLAQGQYQARSDDSLVLDRVRITNAVRCVPPENKPVPEEIHACRDFLAPEISRMPDLRAVLALGQIAHHQVLAALGLARRTYPFGHGVFYSLPPDSGRPPLIVAGSYHCSRYNTNTGRLTPVMFESVFEKLTPYLSDK